MTICNTTKKKVKLNIRREETAYLTGYRPAKLPWAYDENQTSCLKFRNDLKIIFKNSIKYGLKNYLVGMAEGFDMIGAEVLLELRQQFEIKIIAVVPCRGQELKWNIAQQRRYHGILGQCDDVIILFDIYTDTCMNIRNKFMIDHSSVVLACYDGKPGGTRNTISFAKDSGCKIRIINPNDY